MKIQYVYVKEINCCGDCDFRGDSECDSYCQHPEGRGLYDLYINTNKLADNCPLKNYQGDIQLKKK